RRRRRLRHHGWQPGYGPVADQLPGPEGRENDGKNWGTTRDLQRQRPAGVGTIYRGAAGLRPAPRGRNLSSPAARSRARRDRPGRDVLSHPHGAAVVSVDGDLHYVGTNGSAAAAGGDSRRRQRIPDPAAPAG